MINFVNSLVAFAYLISPILIIVVINNKQMTKIIKSIIIIGLTVIWLGGVNAVLLRNQYAHQETIKPYQYVLGKDDDFYYKMLKNGRTYHDYYDGTETKVSDHTGTAIYGKKWVANKNATKYERWFVNQQSIEWYKVEYRKVAN